MASFRAVRSNVTATLLLITYIPVAIAQSPFFAFNGSVRILSRAYVSWNQSFFSGEPVNIWIKESYPHSNAPQVPLNCMPCGKTINIMNEADTYD